MGDPVLVRADGSVTYQLAVVVDDSGAAVDRIVRGRDLATSTAVQVALQQALGFPRPVYRHHFLLLEQRGTKLAKLHGAVDWRAIAGAGVSGPQLCGWLAWVARLIPSPEPVLPQELLPGFSWAQVRPEDVTLRWTGRELLAL
jgi:glutamyl/glutaminyl-tRNA synthetase